MRRVDSEEKRILMCVKASWMGMRRQWRQFIDKGGRGRDDIHTLVKAS